MAWYGAMYLFFLIGTVHRALQKERNEPFQILIVVSSCISFFLIGTVHRALQKECNEPYQILTVVSSCMVWYGIMFLVSLIGTFFCVHCGGWWKGVTVAFLGQLFDPKTSLWGVLGVILAPFGLHFGALGPPRNRKGDLQGSKVDF